MTRSTRNADGPSPSVKNFGLQGFSWSIFGQEDLVQGGAGGHQDFLCGFAVLIDGLGGPKSRQGLSIVKKRPPEDGLYVVRVGLTDEYVSDVLISDWAPVFVLQDFGYIRSGQTEIVQKPDLGGCRGKFGHLGTLRFGNSHNSNSCVVV